MEPTFAETTSETVTAELEAQLASAVAALPPAHQHDPVKNEQFESQDAVFLRLQDWAPHGRLCASQRVSKVEERTGYSTVS